MKRVEITCDGCGADLTRTGNVVDYRLGLACEGMPSRGGVVTDMMVYPPIEHGHHFCDLLCLDLWTDRRRHRDALSKAWWDAWRTEHGTADANGRIRSWPSPAAELRGEKDAEFAAAALAVFPMKQ